MDLTQALDNINVAEGLDEDLLARLGDKVVTDFEMDEDSRSEWLEKVEDWVKLATQVASQKSYPWANASNVKFPLLATA